MELKEGYCYKHNGRLISPEEFAALPEEEKQIDTSKTAALFDEPLYKGTGVGVTIQPKMNANFEPSDVEKVTVDFEVTHCIAKRVEYIGTGKNPLPFPDAGILLLKPLPSRRR